MTRWMHEGWVRLGSGTVVPGSLRLVCDIASPPSVGVMLGAEKFGNPGFETLGAGDPAIWATWNNVEHGDGAVADETTLVHGGSHAAKLTCGPTSNTFIDDYNSLWGLIVPGQTYAFSFWTRGDGTHAGRYRLWDADHSVWLIAQTSTGVPGTIYTQVVTSFTAPAGCTKVAPYFDCPSVNGGIAYFDDVSIKPVTVESFGSLQAGAVNVSVSANLTIPANLQGGVVLALDSATSPANWIVARYNRFDGKIYVDQYIADVLTNLAATTTAYVAAAPLKAIKRGKNLEVFYGGVLVSDVEVVETPYVLAGTFATDVSVTFAHLRIVANP